MSSINKMFDNISRIGTDNCDITNKNIQNTHASNYVLENYSVYSPINNTINLATNQPNVFYQGSPNGGINGSKIDDNSELKLSKLSKSRERSSYQERIFSTVPYLGRGPTNVTAESRLVTNSLNSNRKTSDSNSEVDHTNYVYYPLIPSLEATISNPANLVEGVAAEGWIRGGIPSRILNREQE
jgi:hypothetical protein